MQYYTNLFSKINSMNTSNEKNEPIVEAVQVNIERYGEIIGKYTSYDEKPIFIMNKAPLKMEEQDNNKVSEDILKILQQECKNLEPDNFIDFHKNIHEKYSQAIIFIQFDGAFHIYDECAIALESLYLGTISKIKNGNDTKMISVNSKNIKVYINRLLANNIPIVLVTQHKSEEGKIKRKPTILFQNIEEFENFDIDKIEQIKIEEKNFSPVSQEELLAKYNHKKLGYLVEYHEEINKICKEHIIFIQCGNSFYVYSESAITIEKLEIRESTLLTSGRNAGIKRTSFKSIEMREVIKKLLVNKIPSILVMQYNYHNKEMRRKPQYVISNQEELSRVDFENLFLQMHLKRKNDNEKNNEPVALPVLKNNLLLNEIIDACSEIDTRKVVEFHNAIYSKNNNYMIFIQKYDFFEVFNECATKLEKLGVRTSEPHKTGDDIKYIYMSSSVKWVINKLLSFGITCVLVTQYNYNDKRIKRRPEVIISSKKELDKFDFDNLVLGIGSIKENKLYERNK